MAILVGAQAPDFTLRGWDGHREADFTLSATRGRPMVLVFYPNDEGLVCTKQLCSYSDNMADARLGGAEVWAVSPQGLASHQSFAEGRELRMPLLSDPDRSVARAYGILGPMGLRRSVFVLDAAGRVAWRHVTALSISFPSVADVRAALSAHATPAAA